MKQLKLARERARLTQSELAERLETTQQTIARWEAGKAEPNLAALRDLAINLGVSVDWLLGRSTPFGHRTTRSFARASGEETGYWGNIGVRLPGQSFTKWYPVTTSTASSVSGRLEGLSGDSWISFETLNNKMVVFRACALQAITFLDDAADAVEGDWEVGFGDVEGWPSEVYECLEHLMFEGGNEKEQFSEHLLSLGRDLIEKYELDDQKLMEICLNTRIAHTDGTERWFTVESDGVEKIFYELVEGIEHSKSLVLYVEVASRVANAFLPLQQIALVELPLVVLERGVRDLENEGSVSG